MRKLVAGAPALMSMAAGALLASVVLAAPVLGSVATEPEAEPAAAVAAGGVACARSWVSTAEGCYEDGTAILDVCMRADHSTYALLRAVWLLSEGLEPVYVWHMLGSFATECGQPEAGASGSASGWKAGR